MLVTKPDIEVEICYVSNYMFRLYICSHHQAGYKTLNKKKMCIDCDAAYCLYIHILKHNEDVLSKNILPSVLVGVIKDTLFRQQ